MHGARLDGRVKPGHDELWESGVETGWPGHGGLNPAIQPGHDGLGGRYGRNQSFIL
jgi:hypothetical protein